MSPEKKSPSTQEQGRGEPRSTRPSQTRSRQKSVFTYLSILFAAAFVLLLMTYLMERRESAELQSDLTASQAGQEKAESALQSVQHLYEVNDELQKQVDALEEELAAVTQQNQHLITQTEDTTQSLETSQKALEAMDWFWQINEAYVRGRNATARALIEELGTLDLVDYLPAESVTETGRFSPADRYAEIYDALY